MATITGIVSRRDFFPEWAFALLQEHYKDSRFQRNTYAEVRQILWISETKLLVRADVSYIEETGAGFGYFASSEDGQDWQERETSEVLLLEKHLPHAKEDTCKLLFFTNTGMEERATFIHLSRTGKSVIVKWTKWERDENWKYSDVIHHREVVHL